MTTIYEPTIHTLSGQDSSLGDFEGKTLLLVNVASKCGLTPQYEGLERLQATYGERGFSVLGFPCNQFGGQEPGTSEEAGDIQWNFEKFLVAPNGEIVKRFRPTVDPEAPEVVDAIEASLPG
jgi:glutathione peroxidase